MAERVAFDRRIKTMLSIEFRVPSSVLQFVAVFRNLGSPQQALLVRKWSLVSST